MLCFDIETGPMEDETVFRLSVPFEPPPHPGEFDESKVAYGNLKDEAKRALKLKECQEKHAAAVASYESDLAKAREEWRQKTLADAALDARTGRIVAIGMRNGLDSQTAILADIPEQQLLEAFWNKYRKVRSQNRKLIGSNIFQFDLPFLIRRSWILGVDVPATCRDGRYWDRCFVDLRDLWLLGQRWGDCESSLDAMGRALGIGGKLDGTNGADFAKLWNGTVEEKERAAQYLVRDLELTAEVAKRLGVIV